MDFTFNPTVKELYPTSLDYPFTYSIKTTGSESITDTILKMNYSIGVSAFTKSFVREIILVQLVQLI